MCEVIIIIFNLKKDLFEIYKENNSDFSKYEKTIDYCTKLANTVRGTNNAIFYGVLLDLENLINNASWENKRDQILKIIRDNKNEIEDKYEDYLP